MSEALKVPQQVAHVQTHADQENQPSSAHAEQQGKGQGRLDQQATSTPSRILVKTAMMPAGQTKNSHHVKGNSRVLQ